MSTILTQIIFCIQKRARWRRYEWLRMVTSMIVGSVLLSTTNCVVRAQGIAPAIALTKSVIINNELENVVGWFFA